MHVQVYACMWGEGHRLILGVFLDRCSLSLLGAGFLLNLELISSANLASELAPGISCVCLPSPGLQVGLIHAQLSCGC